MIKVFLLLFIFIFSFGENIKTIDTKIKENSKKITIANKKLYSMNRKLDYFLRKINKNKKILSQTNDKINKLIIQINNLKKDIDSKRETLIKLKKQKKKLLSQKLKLQSTILDYITEQLKLSNLKINSIKDVIREEEIKAVSDLVNNKINKITKQYISLSMQINKIQSVIDNIAQKKQLLLKEKQKLSLLKQEQLKNIATLNKSIADYKNKINYLIKQQKNIQNELLKLKIVKKRIIREMRKKQEEELKAISKVKKYGSSYMKSNDYTYKGKKTIPPIDNFTIVQKFGSYIDPIYKIKIYNDSIKLKAKYKNSKVRAIFDGQVMYINKTPTNGLMIIIKHKNLHTVYANLSRIAPNIKVGKYVKKGNVIGRIKEELEFEVTYKARPINPLEVIKIKK